MAGGYFVGLNAQPNLYSQIYANKQARVDADRAKKDQEAAEKYAKDADKFRIDYSKIHPYHAKEAKMAVAEFMSKADELKKQFPHTYSNTEEYNNAFFNTTSKLEDLTGSSKVIYDEQKLRLEHPDKYETDPNMMKGINEANNAEVSKMLGGRNLFQYGDIAMERWNEQAAAKAIIDQTAQDELLKKDANGKVITTSVGGGTEYIYMTAVKTLNSPQLQKNTLDMWNSSPAMKRKYKTEQEALDWSKGFAEQGTKEITSAIYHATANTGSAGLGYQTDIETIGNAGQTRTTTKVLADPNNRGQEKIVNYDVSAYNNHAVKPTTATIGSNSQIIDNKTGKVLKENAGEIRITSGETAIRPVFKKGVKGGTVKETLPDFSQTPDLGGQLVPKEIENNPKYASLFDYEPIVLGEAIIKERSGAEKTYSVHTNLNAVKGALITAESLPEQKALNEYFQTLERNSKQMNSKKGGNGSSNQQSVPIMIKVTVNGQSGEIPEDQWATFKKDNPTATKQ